MFCGCILLLNDVFERFLLPQLDPYLASIVLFAGRAWDAVTDPTVGFLVSRSPWTRIGRMLPW